MLLAGLRHGAGLYLRIFAPIVAGALLAWAFLGALSGFVTLLLLTVGAYFLLWLRADKRQRRMISQLPAFLDNMVRLITIGNSMASAFRPPPPARRRAAARSGRDRRRPEPLGQENWTRRWRTCRASTG